MSTIPFPAWLRQGLKEATYCIYKDSQMTYAEPSRESGLPLLEGLDSASVIQKAINAVASGSSIVIRAATYNIGSTITITDVVNIYMEPGTILNDTGVGGVILSVNHSGLSVAQGLSRGKMYLLGGIIQIRSNNSTGILLQDIALNGLVCDITVENFQNAGANVTGINVKGQSFGTIIRSSLVSGLLGASNNGTGILFSSSGLGSPNNSSIQFSRLISGWNTGIDVEAGGSITILANVIQTNINGVLANISDLTIAWNYFDTNTTRDIWLNTNNMIGFFIVEGNEFTLTPKLSLGTGNRVVWGTNDPVTVTNFGVGAPGISGLDNRTGITAADGAPITLVTLPSTPATQLYRISADIFATAFTSGTATYTITWTENAVTRTLVVTATALNTLGTGTDLINPDAGTNITAQITGVFVATVKVAAVVEVLA